MWFPHFVLFFGQDVNDFEPQKKLTSYLDYNI